MGGKRYCASENEEEYMISDEVEAGAGGARVWKVKKVKTGRFRHHPYCQGYLMRKVDEYGAEKEKEGGTDDLPLSSHGSDDKGEDSAAGESDSSFVGELSQEY